MKAQKNPITGFDKDFLNKVFISCGLYSELGMG